MIREIVEIGHPTLREMAQEVPVDEIPSKWVQELIDDLIETKRFANGAGLAAPQVAEPWRIFVAEVGNNPRYPYKPPIPLTVVINPQISFNTEDRMSVYEGCLSIPNLRGIVNRCPDVRVEGRDQNGDLVDKTVRGISAGTFQHEDDHLNGILYTDLVTDAKSLCTWGEFERRYEGDFRESVQEIEARYVG
ncbi:MAG: peptide deformylase [Candidatus Latescibacteria bacterium]|nr:peptide deformylase [Candidatus Latescibacterota bacterium]